MLKLEIIGNIGSDAEVKEFGGKKYVSFSVACPEYSKDQKGNKTEYTTWVSILWYGDGGGLLPCLKRGSKVFVRGNLKVKMYTDRNGNQQAAINVSASEVQLCGVKGETSTQQAGVQVQQPTNGQGDDLPF